MERNELTTVVVDVQKSFVSAATPIFEGRAILCVRDSHPPKRLNNQGNKSFPVAHCISV